MICNKTTKYPILYNTAFDNEMMINSLKIISQEVVNIYLNDDIFKVIYHLSLNLFMQLNKSFIKVIDLKLKKERNCIYIQAFRK